MSRNAEPLSQAIARLNKLVQTASAKVHANLDAFSPDAAELVPGCAFADTVSSPQLPFMRD